MSHRHVGRWDRTRKQCRESLFITSRERHNVRPQEYVGHNGQVQVKSDGARSGVNRKKVGAGGSSASILPAAPSFSSCWRVQEHVRVDPPSKLALSLRPQLNKLADAPVRPHVIRKWTTIVPSPSNRNLREKEKANLLASSIDWQVECN